MNKISGIVANARVDAETARKIDSAVADFLDAGGYNMNAFVSAHINHPTNPTRIKVRYMVNSDYIATAYLDLSTIFYIR